MVAPLAAAGQHELNNWNVNRVTIVSMVFQYDLVLKSTSTVNSQSLFGTYVLFFVAFEAFFATTRPVLLRFRIGPRIAVEPL